MSTSHFTLEQLQIQYPNSKFILLTKNVYTIVDCDDYEYLMQWKWYLANTGYAMHKNSKHTLLMHRLVNNTPINLVTDHINGNKLDNRKINLRAITRAQNCMNSKAKCGALYKGIYYSNTRKRWVAEVVLNRIKYYVGSYKTPREAAIAYDKKAIELHGQFAKTNSDLGLL